MRAVIPNLRDEFLGERHRMGLDLWDEMWDGVLHMPPAPIIEHQSFEYQLTKWLDIHWGCVDGTHVYHNVNVASPGGWPDDYRIPDIVLLDSDCPAKNCRTHFEGPTTVAIEIHSPGDEAYEKLTFYAELGVPEVWIIERDTRAVEIYALRRRKQVQLEADNEAWVRSPVTGIQMRTQRRKLAIQITDNPASLKLLPEK